MTAPTLPDARGRFGALGGRFVPEPRLPAAGEPGRGVGGADRGRRRVKYGFAEGARRE